MRWSYISDTSNLRFEIVELTPPNEYEVELHINYIGDRRGNFVY